MARKFAEIIMMFINITYLFYWVILYLLMRKEYNVRKNIYLSALIILIIVLINSFLNSIVLSEIVYRTCMILIELLGIFLVFKLSIPDTILICLIFDLTMALSESIAILILNICFGMQKITQIGSIYYNLGLLVSFIFYAIFIRFSLKLYTFIKSSPNDLRKWIILILPCFTILFIFEMDNLFEIANSFPEIMLILIGFVFSNYIMLHLYIDAMQGLDARTELKISKKRQEFLKEKISMMSQLHNSQYHFLHNLLHMLSELNDSMNKNDLKQMEFKVNQINQEAYREFNLILSDSLALNTVLNQYSPILLEEEIDVQTNVFCDLAEVEFSTQVELYKTLIDLIIEEYKKQESEFKLVSIDVYKKNQGKFIEVEYESQYMDPLDLISLKKLLNKNDAEIRQYYDSKFKIRTVIIYLINSVSN